MQFVPFDDMFATGTPFGASPFQQPARRQYHHPRRAPQYFSYEDLMEEQYRQQRANEYRQRQQQQAAAARRQRQQEQEEREFIEFVRRHEMERQEQARREHILRQKQAQQERQHQLAVEAEGERQLREYYKAIEQQRAQQRQREEARRVELRRQEEARRAEQAELDRKKNFLAQQHGNVGNAMTIGDFLGMFGIPVDYDEEEGEDDDEQDQDQDPDVSVPEDADADTEEDGDSDLFDCPEDDPLPVFEAPLVAEKPGMADSENVESTDVDTELADFVNSLSTCEPSEASTPGASEEDNEPQPQVAHKNNAPGKPVQVKVRRSGSPQAEKQPRVETPSEVVNTHAGEPDTKRAKKNPPVNKSKKHNKKSKKDKSKSKKQQQQDKKPDESESDQSTDGELDADQLHRLETEVKTAVDTYKRIYKAESSASSTEDADYVVGTLTSRIRVLQKAQLKLESLYTQLDSLPKGSGELRNLKRNLISESVNMADSVEDLVRTMETQRCKLQQQQKSVDSESESESKPLSKKNANRPVRHVTLETVPDESELEFSSSQSS